MKIIAVFYLFTSLSETWSYLLSLRGQNNMLIFNIYTIIETNIYVVFIILSTQLKRNLLILLIGLIVLFNVYCIVYSFLLSGLDKFNSGPRTMQGLLMMLLTGVFLIKMISKDEFELRSIAPYQIVLIGIFVYFTGAFFVNMTYGLQVLTGGKLPDLWYIHSGVNIVGNILFGLAFWKCRIINLKLI